MSKKNDFDLTYPQKLKEIGIGLLEQFKGTKTHHKMECLTCFHVWSASPSSKLQNHKKYGCGGCPRCNQERIGLRNITEGKRIIKEIEIRGFTLLEPYTGNKINILVKNNACGHIWKARPNNLLVRNVICKICNDKMKSRHMDALNKQRHQTYLLTATDWQQYKSTVTKLTHISYKNNKSIINPLNLPKGRAGTPGAHHTDHIVPIRYCFNHSIPPEICSHPSNLQMLEWAPNISSKDKLKAYIPPIFDNYIQLSTSSAHPK